MAELQVQGDFNWYVRMFGRDSDGEIYVLVSKNGNPKGETGAVLKLVSPDEGKSTEMTAETTPETQTTDGGATETAAPAESEPETTTTSENATVSEQP